MRDNDSINNISFLVGLKNNLEYSQKFYENTRLFYPDTEIVFVSFGSTDGTHRWLDSLNDINLKYYYSEQNKTLSDTYNKAIEISTKPLVCFLHNDMVLGKYFVKEILKAIEIHPISYYKTVEPPVFGKDERLWKEVIDFGNSFEDFDYKGFYDYEEKSIQKTGQYTDATSFFFACKKDILINLGGLDPLFSPMFCEDDDLILRLRLSGQKMFVCPNAITYHFVSKTSRFSDEFKERTGTIEQNSIRNFYRKWGFGNNSINKNKRSSGLILNNPDENAIKDLEPYVTHIYTDFDPSKYIANEQKNTLISLSEKFRKKSDPIIDDVIITFDCKKDLEKNLDVFKNLNDKIIEKQNKKRYLAILSVLFPNSKTDFTIKNIKFKIIRNHFFEKQLIN